MQYRHLGKSGLQVSEIALGSWLTYGDETESQAEACINRAYELGVNFFDTANVYANGGAERVVGKALAKFPRSSYVLSTKVHGRMGPGPNDGGLSRKHIMEQCEASLKRLGHDYVDIYFCHRFDPGTPVEETLDALADLVRHGKILHYAVSEWTALQIDDASLITHERRLYPILANQPHYSMLARDIEREIIPVCEREGIGQVTFSSLAQGVLTGKYKPGQPPPVGTRAAGSNQFLKSGVLDKWVHDQVHVDNALLARVQKLQPLAEEAGLTMSQLALAWCLRHKNVASVIIGASRPEQVEQNAAASGKTLSTELLTQIDKVLRKPG
jgi:aryl-alcohol dehydrogenase-like predicted oxidoreductase